MLWQGTIHPNTRTAAPPTVRFESNTHNRHLIGLQVKVTFVVLWELNREVFHEPDELLCQ